MLQTLHETTMKYRIRILLVLLMAVTLESGRSLEILGLFPHPGKTHFGFFHPLMRGLAEAGHEVTVITHYPDKSPSVRYKDLPLTGMPTLENSVTMDFVETRTFYRHFMQFFVLYDWGKQACNHTLHSEALAEVLRSRKHYDVILVEQFNNDCMLGVAHILKSPVIGLNSCAMLPWHYERTGTPAYLSYIPDVFWGQSEDMSFLKRVGNWITFHVMNTMYKLITIPTTDSMIRQKFGDDIPSVGDLVKDISLYFVNQHFSLSGVKPLPPSVIELGGIHIQKANPLPTEIQRWLDNAEYGAIFVSWGSMIRADTLPAAKRDNILKAFKRLKQRVIWKWENDTLPNKPSNVLISKWLPQRDILCHPNVKVFMTHGGLLSSSEAAHCGVPTVATPMLGDQFLNAAAMRHRGMGVILQYEDISENSVIKAIKKALEKSYLENVKAISYSFNHRPMTAMQTAIWWVEYVAKTEGASLTKSSAVYMSRFAYYSLDVYVFLGIMIFFNVVVFSWLFRKMLFKTKSTAGKRKTN